MAYTKPIHCASRPIASPALSLATAAAHSSAWKNQSKQSRIRCRQCTRCRSILPVAQAEVVERCQIIDVPTSAFDVVEHRTLWLTCGWGRTHLSGFPCGMTELVQYASAAALIFDVYDLAISPATLLAWVAEASAALQTTADQIAEHLRAAPRRAVAQRRRVGPARGRQTAPVAHRCHRHPDMVRRTRQAEPEKRACTPQRYATSADVETAIDEIH